jgi:uncharacterized protein YndB with AHSA1/START domain
MSKTVSLSPVRKQIRVSASPARAFEVFTEEMTRWWTKSHSINKSPIKEIVMEPRVGGRWFERGEDGSECQWGKVLEWSPPSRLVLAWQITHKWAFDPGLVTEVEVRFTAADSSTLVELEHRNLDRFGTGANEMWKAPDSPGGWMGLLESFGKTAAEAAQG